MIQKKSGKSATLTDKQEKFVQEIIKGNSQRAAYKSAYNCEKMTDKTVDEKACELFNKDKIMARYNILHDRLIKESEDDCIITAKQVIQELAKIALSKGSDYSKVIEDEKGRLVMEVTPTDKLTDAQKSAILGIEQTATGIKVKQHDKVKALELLGKHFGMFIEKQEVTVKDFPKITLKRGE